jgi:multisubunit Na+/H+ antiporter MnhC subunit
MIEQHIAGSRKQQRGESMVKVFIFCLPLIAVILACCISFFSQMPIPIEKPAILMLGSLFILAPFRSQTPVTLQKIIGFYLSSVAVNQLSSQYFSFSFLAVDISISYSAVVLLLCAIGYVLGRLNSTNTPRGVGRANIIYCWVFALTIIVIHMMLLNLTLNKFYGYGYERNLNVLGNLCLYFLLFIALWKKLSSHPFRRSIGLVLTLFYLAVIFVDR